MIQSTFHLLEDSRAQVLDLMRNMVRLSLQEKGCLSYEYFSGLSDVNQIILLQEWEDAESLQQHYKTDHMEHFIDKLGGFLQRPIITRSFVSPEQREQIRKSSQVSESSEASASLDDRPATGQTIH